MVVSETLKVNEAAKRQLEEINKQRETSRNAAKIGQQRSSGTTET